jgi:hypothetical protein
MKNLTIGVGIGVATLFGVSMALAEPFASHGTIAVGVERVFGFDYTHETTKPINSTAETTTSETTIALANSIPTQMSLMPRLNFDVFLGPGISLGGGVMYQHGSASSSTTGVAGEGSGSGSYYLFAPRIGFGIPINENVAIWPRAGISYFYTSTESTNPDGAGGQTTHKHTSGLWYTTIDAMLMLSPVQHVAFNVGPTFDVLIGGPTRTTDGVGDSVDDTSQYSIGVRAGLTVWF